MSLGRCWAGHSLVHRLDMARLHGYKGIELFHEDLADIANRMGGSTTAENELLAAEVIRRMCEERDIAILCLQPFAHYEGLRDRAEHARRIDQLKFWFQLAKVLGTDIIQIPSSFAPASETSGDMGLIVSDLREAADLGLQEQPPIRYVYEALCWGTHVDTWEKSWEIVQAIDRPNFGLCLDTFNITGRIYADPSSPTGTNPDAAQVVRESIARMLATVDVKRVFYVQVVDAERLAEPLVEGHAFYNAEQPCRMSWSRNCRLFYGEEDRGAYLPVADVARAIFHGLGYDGWVSLELFNRRMADTDEGVPRELASRGAISWAKMVRDLSLKVESAPELERIPASL
jgi:4-hydroxyphenylpyruvate dioxygenase